jgi:transmembrane sensor
MSNRYEPEDGTPEARVAEALRSGLLQGVASPAGSDEARLFEAVRLLRDDYVASAAVPDADASSRMLTGIRESMQRGRRAPSPRARLADVARWVLPRPASVAVAAVVVIAIAMVVLRLPGGRVVAESGAETIAYEAPDGSIVTLRPHSRLIATGDDGARSYELLGEAHFAVARDVARPFTVKAGEGRVQVLGTVFTVGSWGRTVRVYVDEGSVRFEGLETGSSLDLTAGVGSELVDGRPIITARLDRAAALDWMEGALVLDSQAFGDVIAEIRQHFAVRIDFPRELESERLTGRILLPDVDQALLDLGIVVGGEFVRTGPSEFRFERD